MKILLNGYLNLLPPRNGHHYGGPQSFTNAFINYLDKKTKHDFTAVILRSDKNLASGQITVKKIKEGQHNWLIWHSNLKIKNIIKARATKLPASWPKTVKQLNHLIKKIRPDVVLLNGFSVSNWYLLKAASQAGYPMIATHHGLWFKDIEATSPTYTPAGRQLGLQMEKDIPVLVSKQIFFNDFSRQVFFKKIGGEISNKISYLNLPYNSLYLNKSKPRVNKTKKLKIGLIGRWDNIKNHQAFLRLAQKAKQHHLDWEFYAVTYWTLNKPLSNFQKNYQKHVKLIDQMTPARLKKFYHSMHILVLPSHFDVSPTVVMEAALQNRLTIISSQVGWTNLYNKFKLNKLIADFKNPQQIIKLIKRQVHQPVPQKFYNYIKNEHHPDKVFKKYLSIITSTLK